MKRRTAGFLWMIVSGVCFGSLGLFGQLAYGAGVDVPTLLFLRFSLAGGVLLGVMLLRRQRFPRGRVLVSLVLLGAVGYVTEALAFFAALTMASAGLVALLLYLYPALVALLSVVVNGERLSRLKGVAIAVALGGTALTIDPGGSAKPLGLALGVLSALIYAVYILVSARVVGSAGPLATSTVILGSAGLMMGLVVLARGPAWPQTGQGWAAVVALALVSTVAAVLTFFAGLERVGPVNASLLSTIEPVIAVLLGALVVGDKLSLRQGVGGVLILGAVVMLARLDAKHPSPTGRGTG